MEEPNAEMGMPTGELKGITFYLMTNTEMEKSSSVSIVEPSDVSSAKLGLPNGAPQCETCGAQSVRECDGHSGVIKLPATVFNPHLFEEVVQLLNQICPGCHTPKQNRDSKRSDGATSQATCKYCSKDGTKQYPDVIFKTLTSPRMTLSKAKLQRDPSVMDKISLTAEVADRVTDSAEVLPLDYWDFVPHHHPPQSNMTKILLSPYQASHILKQLDPELFSRFASRPELIFLSCLPVTPNFHRVAELPYGFSDGPRLAYDDLTKAYKRTVDVGRKLDDLRQHPQFSVLASSLVTSRVVECLKLSKLHSKKTDKESSTDTHGMKWLKDAILSKRSDNAFRGTMVGDPKIRLHEIGIPVDLASNLLVSEHVNSYNFDSINSKCNCYLLANEKLVIKRSGKTIIVRKPNQLVIGDTVHRLLQDGDLILINRPPSIHQHSVIGLSAKLLPVQSVLSINPLCCAPLAGDFDGDCLHGYVPQSIQSRVELEELVSLSHQLLNAQDGRSLVSLTHDSLAAAYLLTSSEVLLKKTEVQQFQMLLCHPLSPTPGPAIMKSIHSHGPLWTGKQLFSMLLPSDMSFSIEPKVHIIDGEVLACPSESFWLQNSISGLFSVMFKQYGDKALELLSSAQDVLCEFLTMRGLSVSLSDIYLFPDHDSRRKLADGVNLALDDAEEAFRIKQILLSPDSISILKCYDDCADLSQSYEQSNFIQSNLPIIKSSIMAFKSVFSDLQKMVQQHTAKNNSMMMMTNAGSKGSMLKFVQQTACVGLQLPASRFPFRIPSELSCASWNRHKSEGTGECLGGQNLYAVIRNSFAGGLNPLECLLHSISGRANFFSENADVPGTLTRKLMYHLRDLYVAYDGTVRSSYGQQIMQFTYDTAEDMCSDRNVEGELGAPVGSWAACSISEAAYGALDHPVNSLEESPLMNLQDVLKCQKGGTSMDHVGLLFLSKNLKKYRYGLEYASLEVKDHLEPVNFSDLVDTVMILYGGCGIESTKGSPWITHFHLSQEMMTKKRLGLTLVVEELTEQYNAKRDKLNFPKVYISKGKCSADNECGNRQTCCITVVTQDDSNSMSQLDTIKKRVIPNLLALLVKGFLEFKKVEIQCQEDSELVVKVVMSEEHCKSVKFWATLQKSCIAIMELIDWERSRPGSVYDIFCSYGIDSAWKYFVESLRSKTDDIGRNIRREHLLVVANCLSVSGQFHGLSSQGLKQQRTRLSISSPFSEACFSRPAHTFINAAKQSSVDNLCGTVDAMTWGKEPSTGTSGPFKIIYSGKAHAPIPNENIYDFLNSPEVRQAPGEAFLNGSTISVEQDFLVAAVGIWDNIIDMRTCLQNMLREYQLNECVGELDKSRVIEALRFHPRGREKIGAGIEDIKIGHHPSHPGTRCFIMVRDDGTTEDFSYKKCVQGAADSISPELGRYVERILRNRAVSS
ncbi:DNA-directed RNA polymerase IV subunit 1-like [Triticum dicoccoides]|uniref:DNA-directed RNA polymerase IV subunit 1-like n=1 Tax=Triticum dicoccoides TaxID=85692 RepID=UPI000E7C2AA5|nr:DNA-directed RNA polymerase IV subunit 1-like [Triticum dicoccoides]XP_037488211.1 DNA-directed RNA polymerase IV subunit 1-like [Triticum dicoccoides]XP_037488219.1 DNA-directed RNA polymerase IV subunit 1-like [Triticum dicoccoides]